MIAGIVRNRKIIVPTGLDAITAGDRVIVFSTNHGINDLADIAE